MSYLRTLDAKKMNLPVFQLIKTLKILLNSALAIIILLFSLSFLYGNDIEDFEYIHKLSQNKYYNEAISELETFLIKYPGSSLYYNAEYSLGYHYFITEKYTKAKGIFEILKSSEYKSKACFYLMLIALKDDDTGQAEKDLRQIEDKDPLKSEALFDLANYYYKKNDFIKAISHFSPVLMYKDSFYPDTVLNLGVIYFQQQEYAKAITMLEEYIRLKTTDQASVLAYFLLAQSYEKMNAASSAILYYKTIEQKYVYSEYTVKSFYQLAKIYHDQKNNEQLKEYARKLIGSEYEKQALLLLAENEYENKNYSESEQIYKKILEKNKDVSVLYKLVLSLIMQEKYDQALAQLPSLKSSEYKAEYYYYTAYIFFKQKEYKALIEKISIFEEEKIKTEFEKDIYQFLAESSYFLDDYVHAEKYYLKLYSSYKEKKYLYYLLWAEYKLKNFEKFKAYYQDYPALFPDDKQYKKDLYTWLGEYYVSVQEYEKAEKLYLEYLKNEQDDIIINNLIAVLLKEKKYDALINYLEQGEDSFEKMYLKGVSYMGLNQYGRAIEIFKEIIKNATNPFVEKSYVKLVDALWQSSNYREALIYTAQYLEKGFQENKILIMDKKGLAYFKLQEYQNAVSAFEELEQVTGEKDYAVFMLAETYYNLKNPEKAGQYYQEVVDQYPKSAYRKMSLYWLIQIATQNNDFDRLKSYSQAFLKDYNNSEYSEEILLNSAKAYLSQNQVNQAVQEYQKLYSLTAQGDTKEYIVKTLVKIYFDQKKYPETLNWLKKTKEDNFKTLWTGLVLDKQGKNTLAVQEYEKLSGDMTYGDVANYNLGNYYIKQKKYEQGRTYLEKVLESDNSEYKDEALLKIGLSYEEEGNFQKAVVSLMKIKLLYPSSPFQDIVELKLGENYEKLNETEKAIELYTEFFQQFKQSSYFGDVTEKLLAYHLEKQNKEEAEKYYLALQQYNKSLAQKYEKYFSK